MKKTFERSEECLSEATREDEAFNKMLYETYPDLKLLDEVKTANIIQQSEESSKGILSNLTSNRSQNPIA